MIEETVKESTSKGVALWEKVKIKIKAVQSFLNLHNEKQKQENQILNKRKNPFSHDEFAVFNEEQDFGEAISKKLKDNNGEAKDQVLDESGSNNKSQNNQMEVLNEGSSQLDNLLNEAFIDDQGDQLDESFKNQILMQENIYNQESNIFGEDNSDKNYSTNNLNSIYKQQSSYEFKNENILMSLNNETEQSKSENRDNNQFFKNYEKQNTGESFNQVVDFSDQKEQSDCQKNQLQDDEDGDKQQLDQIQEDQQNEEELDSKLINQDENNEDQQQKLKDSTSGENEQQEQKGENEINKDEQTNEDQEEEEDDDDGDDDDEEEEELDENDREEDYEDEDEEDNEDGGNEYKQIDNEKQKQREQEDSLVKQEDIFVTDAILDEDENQNNQQSQQKDQISFDLNEQENIITIRICSREYKIDLNKEIVQKNEKLIQIVNDIADLVEQLKIKQNEKIQELEKITDHNQFTALEYYLMKTIDDIFKQERQIQNQQWQEEICCICQCDLFENIDQYSQQDFLKQLQNSSDEDPINLAHCESHFFHKSCLKMMIQSTYIKCPVCSKIYGVMIGDQPPGSMSIYLDKYSPCDGYPDNSTIVIEMRMKQTTKNGVSVPSTSRVGYLPNTEEARKILEMFKIAFKRRLLYTIGKSVTTGKDNRIIWNGVHFKTNTYGGSSSFGYPDPTYFQRVTQELSLKGIYPKD